MKRVAAWLAAPAALLLAHEARAQVGCEVDVAPISFGVYDTLSPAANQAAGSVTVTCRLLDPNAAERISYSIALGPGSGSYARRTMRAAGSAETLGYNIHLRAVSPATVWGDGTGGTVTASGSMTINKNSDRRPLVLPLVGVIAPMQPVSPGLYSDTLTVTVTWN
ncbi:spore coat U domain-containing protein [Burkholderiaceae bacterium FT117]|uniref:Csu type fimbrial protein n=1 Tax=Zeimonas sediminis TaxID=2944268 RepID=UPI0023431947|nr:spore coat U domain-containing protein [Zeimonas sediminis]MCM5569964.1 spore coat U domain-containing protein [Zeimonas sediminis]